MFWSNGVPFLFFKVWAWGQERLPWWCTLECSRQFPGVTAGEWLPVIGPELGLLIIFYRRAGNWRSWLRIVAMSRWGRWRSSAENGMVVPACTWMFLLVALKPPSHPAGCPQDMLPVKALLTAFCWPDSLAFSFGKGFCCFPLLGRTQGLSKKWFLWAAFSEPLVWCFSFILEFVKVAFHFRLHQRGSKVI